MVGQRHSRENTRGLALAHPRQDRDGVLVGGVDPGPPAATERDRELGDGSSAQLGRGDSRVQPHRLASGDGLAELGAGADRCEETVLLATVVGAGAVVVLEPPAEETKGRSRGDHQKQREDEHEEPARRCEPRRAPGARRVEAVDDESDRPGNPPAPEPRHAVQDQQAAQDRGDVEEEDHRSGDPQGGEGELHPQRLRGRQVAGGRVVRSHGIHPSRSGLVPVRLRVRRSTTPSPRTFASAMVYVPEVA